MTRIRQWIRSLAIALYDIAATNEDEQFWALEKQAKDAAFWLGKFRSASNDLEMLEASLAELQAPPPAPKKKTARKKKVS